MVTLFSDVIDLNALCGPCGDPADPQPASYWEQSTDGGVTWVQLAALPDSEDNTYGPGDQFRYVCPSGGVSGVITISEENMALGLDSFVNRVYSEGDLIDLSMFTCSDGTPINEWRASADGGLTYFPITAPTTASIGFDCLQYQFRCDGDWSDASVMIDVEPTSSSYFDQTFNITQGINQFFTVCFPCSGTSGWEYRIDDAFADEDHVDAPNLVTGDRPNSDPGFPSPDDEWQAIPYQPCQDCAIISVEDLFIDGINPDPGSPQLGEYFVKYIRAICNGTPEPPIKLTFIHT